MRDDGKKINQKKIWIQSNFASINQEEINFPNAESHQSMFELFHGVIEIVENGRLWDEEKHLAFLK